MFSHNPPPTAVWSTRPEELGPIPRSWRHGCFSAMMVFTWRFGLQLLFAFLSRPIFSPLSFHQWGIGWYMNDESVSERTRLMNGKETSATVDERFPRVEGVRHFFSSYFRFWSCSASVLCLFDLGLSCCILCSRPCVNLQLVNRKLAVPFDVLIVIFNTSH